VAISFVFAVLEESDKTISLLVLDDPAISLDDEHKARLLDHLISPSLGTRQVILSTHYERFYKQAEAYFLAAERLQLVPRRTSTDVVAFEPMDLLQRLTEALQSRGCSWREVGNNLRRWVERVLHALSAYCPQPFVVFNDIPTSVATYKRMTDPQIATPARDKI